MWVTTSPLVPAHDAHDATGDPDADCDPPAAAPKFSDSRVVTLETFAVPDAPGSPVCNCTNRVVTAVKVAAEVPRSTLSHALAVLAALRPTVTGHPPRRRPHGQPRPRR